MITPTCRKHHENLDRRPEGFPFFVIFALLIDSMCKGWADF